MVLKIRFAFVLVISLGSSFLQSEEYDLVIYGGTSAAVAAAVQAKKMGRFIEFQLQGYVNL